jgi:hypothetical protein
MRVPDLRAESAPSRHQRTTSNESRHQNAKKKLNAVIRWKTSSSLDNAGADAVCPRSLKTEWLQFYPRKAMPCFSGARHVHRIAKPVTRRDLLLADGMRRSWHSEVVTTPTRAILFTYLSTAPSRYLHHWSRLQRVSLMRFMRYSFYYAGDYAHAQTYIHLDEHSGIVPNDDCSGSYGVWGDNGSMPTAQEIRKAQEAHCTGPILRSRF